jgi:lipopolysaccharide export system protein LptA
MKTHRLVILFLALLGFTVYAGGALGAPPAKASTPKKGTAGEFPLHITAARLEADQNAGIIIFSGQVKAEYGDATLYADQLRVYYQPTTPAKTAPGAAPASPSAKAGPPSQDKGASQSPLGFGGGEKIDRIVAQGQVRFVQEDRLATGQEAIYYKAKDEVVLLGNPQLWRGENTLKGDRIVFNLKENKTTVESSSQKRVEAHLYSAAPGAGGGKECPASGTKGRKERKP